MSYQAGLLRESVHLPPLSVTAPAAGHRHALSILDPDPTKVLYLCRRAIRIKPAPADPRTLRGRKVGVYFRKTSTRTRTAFTVGAGRLRADLAPLLEQFGRCA